MSEPDGVPFDHSADSLGAVRVWNLVTDHGRLDLTFEPSGTQGYEDVSRDAVHLVTSVRRSTWRRSPT